MGFKCQKCPSEIDKLDGKAIPPHRRYLCRSCGQVHVSADGERFVHQLDFGRSAAKDNL